MTDIKSISKMITPIAKNMVQTRWHCLVPEQRIQQQKQMIIITSYQREKYNHYFS